MRTWRRGKERPSFVYGVIQPPSSEHLALVRRRPRRQREGDRVGERGRQLAVEISGTQSCSRSEVGGARLPRAELLLERPPISPVSVRSAICRPPRGRPSTTHALAHSPGQSTMPVLVAIVPAVEHELVEPAEAVLEVELERLVAGPRRDELVDCRAARSGAARSRSGVIRDLARPAPASAVDPRAPDRRTRCSSRSNTAIARSR